MSHSSVQDLDLEDPEHLSVAHFRARAFMDAGREVEALVLLERLIQSDQVDASVWRDLTKLRLQRGNTESARLALAGWTDREQFRFSIEDTLRLDPAFAALRPTHSTPD